MAHSKIPIHSPFIPGVCSGGCLLWGSAQRSVCSGGCLLLCVRGGVCSGGVSAPGVGLSARGGWFLLPGVCVCLLEGKWGCLLAVGVYSGGSVCSRGVSALGGWKCLLPGVSALGGVGSWGGVCSQGVSAPRGVCSLEGVCPGGVSFPGGVWYPSMH